MIIFALVIGFMVWHLINSCHRNNFECEENYNSFSILLPAYNEEACISRSMLEWMKLEYKGDFEIIIINNNSSDYTLDIANKFCGGHIKVITCTKQGKANALNMGLELAQYDYMVSVDLDSIPDQNLLYELNKVYNKDENIVACGGRVGTYYVNNEKPNYLMKMQEVELDQGFLVLKKSHNYFGNSLTILSGCLTSCKMSFMREYNISYDEGIWEDLKLTLDIQKVCKETDYYIEYNPNAVVRTQVLRSYKAFYKQRKRWARSYLCGVQCFKLNDFKKKVSFLLFIEGGLFSYLTNILSVVWIISALLSGASVLFWILFFLGFLIYVLYNFSVGYYNLFGMMYGFFIYRYICLFINLVVLYRPKKYLYTWAKPPRV